MQNYLAGRLAPPREPTDRALVDPFGPFFTQSAAAMRRRTRPMYWAGSVWRFASVAGTIHRRTSLRESRKNWERGSELSQNLQQLNRSIAPGHRSAALASVLASSASENADTMGNSF